MPPFIHERDRSLDILPPLVAVCGGKVGVVTEQDPQEEAAEGEKSYNQPRLARRQVAERVRHLTIACTGCVASVTACAFSGTRFITCLLDIHSHVGEA